jgi:YD repeat-containing protein
VGSVLEVIREDGEVVCRYDYDAFGNLIEGNSYLMGSDRVKCYVQKNLGQKMRSYEA